MLFLLVTCAGWPCVSAEDRGLRVEVEAVLGKEAYVYTTWPFNEAEAKRRQQETAQVLGLPVEYDEDLGNGVKMRMVLIPAGEFVMGSPDGESGRDDDEVQHRVRLTKPFYMGKYEVTQAQWEVVTGDNPSHFEGKQNPVEKVSWEDVQGFVQKLNAKGGPDKAGEYKRVYGLPTEAEWEYACRSGSSKRFCFGDSGGDLGQYAWYRENSGSKTHPVGEKKANAWGLHDMHGNVWEWCEDRYGSYETGAQTDLDPKGPSAGGSRVLRGGGWFEFLAVCRSALRYVAGPDYRYDGWGVRLVVVPGALR